MSKQPTPSDDANSLSDVQSALFELHEGLMSLKASLLELARTHEEEIAMHNARAEACALIDRIRRHA